MIGYYIHHHGAGHLTRAQAVADALGEPVTGLSSLPRPARWAGDWVQLTRDDEPTPTPGQDVTAGGVLHWAPVRHAGYVARMADLAAWAGSTRPRVLVVDVSVEITLLGRLLGVPVVVLAMRGQRTDAPHQAAYDAATRLIAPWPEQCPEDWWPRNWLAKTEHVGAFSRFDGLPSPGPPRPRHGVLLWGMGGQGDPDMAGLAAATPGWTWEQPAGAAGPDIWAALGRADVVVLHGGQNAVAEVAAARRPAVVVADPRPFDEQAHTCLALNRSGLAVALQSWPQDGEWLRLLEQARERTGQEWAAWNDGLGAVRAAAAIRAVADRGIA